MSGGDLKVEAKARKVSGKGDVNRLRKDGWFPGIVYGMGKNTELIKVNEHEFTQLLSHHASEHLFLDLVIEGKPAKKVLLKEVQHHAVKGNVLHADFHEVSLTEKLEVQLLVELIGEPVGVTQQGGVLEQSLREIEVECLPTDIIEQVELDVSQLEIGGHVTVGDIKLDSSKFEIKTAADVTVASVSAPKLEEASEEGAEAGAEGAAEPEVISERKGDEEDAEEKKEDS